MKIEPFANLSGANLSVADFYKANLSWANLSEANLSRANLSGADLSWANLSGADLSWANLYGANLSEADLSGANLSGANIRHCVGNMKEVRSMQLDTWRVIFTKDILAIGCKQYTIKEWQSFTDDKIVSMDGKNALKLWYKWKDFIFQAIELSFGA